MQHSPATGFFYQHFPHLPNFEDTDPTLDEQMEIIIAQDAEIRSQIALFITSLDFHEKMALAIYAVVAVDRTHPQLCMVAPVHKAHSPVLRAAIALLRHLSPQALCELAIEILSDDWDLGTDLDAPSTLIEQFGVIYAIAKFRK